MTPEVDSPTLTVRVGVLITLCTRSLSVVVTGSTFTGEPTVALATWLSRSDTALARGVVTGASAPLRTVLALRVALPTEAVLLAMGRLLTTEVDADEQARPRSRTVLTTSPAPGMVGVPHVLGLASVPLPVVAAEVLPVKLTTPAASWPAPSALAVRSDATLAVATPNVACWPRMLTSSARPAAFPR